MFVFDVRGCGVYLQCRFVCLSLALLSVELALVVSVSVCVCSCHVMSCRTISSRSSVGVVRLSDGSLLVQLLIAEAFLVHKVFVAVVPVLYSFLYIRLFCVSVSACVVSSLYSVFRAQSPNPPKGTSLSVYIAIKMPVFHEICGPRVPIPLVRGSMSVYEGFAH